MILSYCLLVITYIITNKISKLPMLLMFYQKITANGNNKRITYLLQTPLRISSYLK